MPRPYAHIESLDDPRIDDYRNIPDPQLLASRGIFIAEGRLVVRRLLDGGRFSVRSVLVTPTALESLGEITSNVPIYVADQKLLSAIAGYNVHRGCLAAAIRPAPVPWRQLATTARTLLVLEDVGNVDNIGGIFRNAAAFGVDAVLLGPGCADPLYRKAIRTSMAATLQIPFATMTDWPADVVSLRDAGFTLLGMTPSADALPLVECMATLAAARIALVLGHEGNGLSEETMRAADIRVRIPLAEGVDSLNVATAAGVALYELRRNL